MPKGIFRRWTVKDTACPCCDGTGVLKQVEVRATDLAIAKLVKKAIDSGLSYRVVAKKFGFKHPGSISYQLQLARAVEE